MAHERAPNLIPKSESLDAITGSIRETLTRILPSRTTDIEGEKKEIWKDLSMVYFKYEDEIWRKAFREILMELFDKISDVKWDEIYSKIYSEEKMQ